MSTEEWINQALVSEIDASNSQPSVPGNQALISALSACNIEPSSNALVIWHSTPVADATANVAGNPPPQDNVATTSQDYLVNNFKLQIIVKGWDILSISDEGSCVVSSLMPNAHMSEVVWHQHRMRSNLVMNPELS